MPDPKASRPHMPDYGLLDAESGRGLLPWGWAEERLTRSHNYWVSTTSADGRPHAMPVWGLWMDGAFWFSTAAGSRKARNLAVNANCVITTEHADEAVIVEGAAEAIAGKAAFKRFADAYKPKYDWDMSAVEDGVFLVRPRVVFGFIEHADQFGGSATRWVFE